MSHSRLTLEMHLDVERAIAIVRHLADGVDPHTGDVLPSDTPYQHADTVRALYHALDALSESQARAARTAERTRRLARAAGTPWAKEEDDRLSREFRSNQSIAAIAATHGRTQGAINSRLLRLGLLGGANEGSG
jgi:hypothetical protein